MNYWNPKLYNCRGQYRNAHRQQQVENQLARNAGVVLHLTGIDKNTNSSLRFIWGVASWKGVSFF